MPDIWTTRPDHMKAFLTQLGAQCGQPARIIEGRNPEFTCYVNGHGWIGDIYIHKVSHLWTIPGFVEVVLLGVLAGTLAGIRIGKFLKSSTD